MDRVSASNVRHESQVLNFLAIIGGRGSKVSALHLLLLDGILRLVFLEARPQTHSYKQPQRDQLFTIGAAPFK